jgi:hypothetical protein
MISWAAPLDRLSGDEMLSFRLSAHKTITTSCDRYNISNLVRSLSVYLIQAS